MTIQSLKTDILIVGAGPAGMTAGIYTARAGKKTLILEGREASRLAIDYTIENYPGYVSVGSRELLAKFREQAEYFGARVVPGEAIAFALDTDPKYVTTKDAVIEAAAVILATGRPMAKTRLVLGEERLLGQGVSYCATCDGPFFRGAQVAAVGRTPEAVEEVGTLSQIGCRVLWIPETGRADIDVQAAADLESRGVRVVWDAKVKEIAGSEKVEKIVLDRNGALEEHAVAAVFLFRNVPAGPLLGRAGLALDHKQCVSVDRFQRTNIPGVFAAGDVTCGGLQVVAAAGEGCVAAMQALHYLRK
jgi:thioredoxin reductase (NADPH)